MGSTHETPGRFAPGESGIVGVFGMDLEGLEVVSGCSKRFIWKLTDISMNSCVDLLSPPAWWCGLKSSVRACCICAVSHHLRGGVDWNRLPYYRRRLDIRSPPAWWCGLKSWGWNDQQAYGKSPPAWWCGLKYVIRPVCSIVDVVTTCVVVWIEICLRPCSPVRISRHHLRGGVDWNSPIPSVSECSLTSPPAWWCGLKFIMYIKMTI